jgi:hypothetical protein
MKFLVDPYRGGEVPSRSKRAWLLAASCGSGAFLARMAKFLAAPNADAFLPSGDDHPAAHLGSGFRRGRGIGVGRRKMKALDG